MRNTVLLILAFLAVACSPVKIAIDTTSSEGERRIATSKEPILKFGDGKIALGLGLKISAKDTVMAVIASCDATTKFGVFNRGGLMKFRLKDDTEITLSNILDKKLESHAETQVTEHYETSYGYAYSYRPWGPRGYVHPYEMTTLVPEYTTTQKTTSYALYLLNKEQLLAIINKGVAKFRIETESDDHDLSGYDAEMITGVFQALRDCMLKAVFKEKKEF